MNPSTVNSEIIDLLDASERNILSEIISYFWGLADCRPEHWDDESFHTLIQKLETL